MSDAEFYGIETKDAEGNILEVKGIKPDHKNDKRCMVKVGMTKPHGLMIEDKETGERKYIKVPAKPRYKEVGLP
jgi:hypothetical protein